MPSASDRAASSSVVASSIVSMPCPYPGLPTTYSSAGPSDHSAPQPGAQGGRSGRDRYTTRSGQCAVVLRQPGLGAGRLGLRVEAAMGAVVGRVVNRFEEVVPAPRVLRLLRLLRL